MEVLLVIYVVVINVILRYSGVEHTSHTVLVTVGIAFCLILSCVSFIGIYRVVRRHQTVIQAQAQTAARLHGQPPLHIAKVKKSFRTFVLVLGRVPPLLRSLHGLECGYKHLNTVLRRGNRGTSDNFDGVVLETRRLIQSCLSSEWKTFATLFWNCSTKWETTEDKNIHSKTPRIAWQICPV